MDETGLSAHDFGNIVFFFFIAYTLANPLWGSVLDFVGLRIGMFAPWRCGPPPARRTPS